MSIITKKCKNCFLEKSLDKFYSHAITKDRLRSNCKSCWNVDSKQRRLVKIQEFKKKSIVVRTKKCACCKLVKNAAEFYVIPEKRTGLSSHCCRCDNKRKQKEYYRDDKKYKQNKRVRFEARKCKEKWKLYNLKSAIKKFPGFSLTAFKELMKSQNGLCAICENINIGDARLAIDHDHVTGKVRGLLCNKHNLLIGLANEDVNILEKTILYLKLHEGIK